MLMLTFLLVFSALVWATSDEEEEDDDPVGLKSFMIKKRVNAAYIILGASHLQANPLNQFLESSNLPTVKQNFFFLRTGGACDTQSGGDRLGIVPLSGALRPQHAGIQHRSQCQIHDSEPGVSVPHGKKFDVLPLYRSGSGAPEIKSGAKQYR